MAVRIAVLWAGLLAGVAVSSPATAGVLTGGDVDAVAGELDAEGRYLELDADADLRSSIDNANDSGIAFVWLDTPDADQGDAADLMDELDALDSSFRTVLLLSRNGVWAQSVVTDPTAAALDALPLFAAGRYSEGVDVFVRTLNTTSSGAGSTSNTGDANGSGSGGGLNWLWILLLIGVVFFGFRYVIGKRRDRRAEAELIEIDRAEIAEQLKDNADRVIDLGDAVIAGKDDELIRIYEEASAAYQTVSTELAAASSVEAINRLDEKIDHAEWQFELIEARLAGRPVPAEPDSDESEPDSGPPERPVASSRRTRRRHDATGSWTGGDGTF